MEAPRPRRSPWFWVAIGCGGALVLAALTCVAAVVLSSLAARRVAQQVETGTTQSWSEAAARTDLQVYEPTYLPPSSGTPEIIVVGLGNALQTVTANYAGGLQIVEINRKQEEGNVRREVSVRGAERAYIATSGALMVRKGTTWIILNGASEDELLRIAESLRRV